MKILKLLFLMLIILSCNKDDDQNELTPKIDLEAEEFKANLVLGTPLEGLVNVVGIVKNAGENFSSSSGQQFIGLYRKHLGGAEDLVARIDFTTLDADEILEVSYMTSWSTTDEFPPEHILRIEYTEDILTDDNVFNDDDNSENNSLVISGYDINDMLRD